MGRALREKAEINAGSATERVHALSYARFGEIKREESILDSKSTSIAGCPAS